MTDREDQQSSQTHQTATHDAPWSFVFNLKRLSQEEVFIFMCGVQNSLPLTYKNSFASVQKLSLNGSCSFYGSQKIIYLTYLLNQLKDL